MILKRAEAAVRHVLRQLPAETAHDLALRVLAFAPDLSAVAPDRLRTQLCGLDLAHPVGLAAGFDKNARIVDGLLCAGFAFVETGTVTPRPQPGNPKPRLFRLDEDGAIINRMGFNNDGLERYCERLSGFRSRTREPRGSVGANIGINKDSSDPLADYAAGLRKVSPLADYVTINISSPNTPGLRALQAAEALRPLLERICEERIRTTPVLLKIAPDLDGDELDAITDLALQYRLDGMIVSNTTISRPSCLAAPQRQEAGGLSGKPLHDLALAALRRVAQRTEGRLDLVGVGGISTAADVYERIRAGACCIQLYTAFVYHGPFLIRSLLEDLDTLLQRDGLSSIREAVGIDL